MASVRWAPANGRNSQRCDVALQGSPKGARCTDDRILEILLSVAAPDVYPFVSLWTFMFRLVAKSGYDSKLHQEVLRRSKGTARTISLAWRPCAMYWLRPRGGVEISLRFNIPVVGHAFALLIMIACSITFSTI